MDSTNQKLNEFFSEYEARFNKAMAGNIDTEGTANAFASCFIEASPFGVNCGKNDEQFRAMIPKGYEFYRSIGTKSMKIISLDISSLDSFHSTVKVHWQANYIKKDGSEESIDFDVIYFIQMINDQLKVFAYITGDEQGALRERGLIPG